MVNMRYLLSILAAMMLAGCAAKPPPVPSQALTGLSASVGRGDARADSIVMVAKNALPPETKAQILELAGKIKADFVSMLDQLEQNRRDMKLMDGEINTLKTDIAVKDAWQKYEDTWWFGPRFWFYVHWFFAIGVGLIVAYFAIGWFAAATPILAGGKFLGIGLWLFRNLPFMGTFSATHAANMSKAGP